MLDRLSDRIDLPPLAPNQVGEMIDALLRPHELPESFLTDIVERAAGNPLFVEESVKSLAERGVLGRQSGVWRLVGEPRTVAVPETIESLLTTRIDALDGSAKQVLQCAAIVGRRFWSRVLADALVQRPVERELSDLEDGAFVRSLPFSSLGDSPEFMFEHLLLHEVAYDGMLRGLRSELHGAVAHWLESHSAGASGEYDEWIAFHHERSKEPARAVPYLERSAQNARDRGALREARLLAKRALELASLAGDKARLLGLAEDLASEAGEAEARQQAIEELVRLARDEDDERVAAEAAYRRARYLLDSGDLVGARSAGEAALERFEWLDDVSLQADALRLLGRVAHLWGDYPQALRHYRASLPLEREAGDHYGQAEIFDRLGLVQIDLDDFTTALDYFEAARDLCLELGDRPAEARVTGHQAMAQYWLARYEEAEATAREALKLADCCASRQAQSGAKLTLAMVLAARGSSAEAEELLAQVRDFARQQRQPGFEARAWLALAQATTGDDARARARRACQLAKESGVVHVEILGLTREAELDLDVGDWRRADEHSREAMRLLNLHGNIPGPEEAVVYTRARVLQAVGKVREAAETLGRARQIVQGKADRIADVAQRRRYLQNVPLNREILAADLLDQDREVPGEAR